MGRKPRIEYKGGVYHVIQRGNNREYIFKGEEEKKHLMALVAEYKTIMDFKLYGFVVMDNHYHMVIKTLEVPLQDIMHRINNKYSKHYNRKNGRTGHVFESRYKGILVKDNRYLLSLLRYVHQNPVEAKICKRVKDYLWSSDQYYRKNKHGGMVDIDFVLKIFAVNRAEAIQAYIEFMDVDKMEESSIFEKVLMIGETAPVRSDMAIEKGKDPRKTLDEILQEVTQNETIYDEIKAGSRKRTLTSYKRAYIQCSLNCNYTMREIGVNISISEAAICKMISGNIK